MDRETLIDLLPAYALGALDEEEQTAVEQLLAADSEARALLADYQAVADQLLIMAPLRRAPDHLRDDLRQRLAAERTATVKHPRRGIRLALVAAAALVVILVGALILGDRANREEKKTPAQAFAEISEEKNALWYNVVPGDAGSGVQGVLCATPNGDQAIIQVKQLPALDADQTFQMWLADTNGTVRSGGIFRVKSETAYLAVPLDKPLAFYKFIGVSLEPAGGSPYPNRPSGPRVFSIPIQSS